MAEEINWRKYAGRFRTFPKRINEATDPDVRMVICIPVYAEPDVTVVLESLFQCEFDSCKVEVILLFNTNSTMSLTETDLHQKSWKQCLEWVKQHPSKIIRVIPVYIEELPDSLGGVGWARKIAMDEAGRRLDGNGIIVCLDADCRVAVNYLESIYQHFLEFKSSDAASIFIEHELDQLKGQQLEAIIKYELHLRYLINAQQWCGHPFAHQTIGSAMAVRRKAYLDQGGMNTRRAGEDFYFLQKFIEVGTCMQITNTSVYPSARVSSRVPFGTGKAMQQILDEHESWYTPDFEIFKRIKPLFHNLDKLRLLSNFVDKDEAYLNLEKELGLSSDLIDYFREIEFLEECNLVAKHTASLVAFRHRFFRYFNSFKMIKYMHYMRDHHFPDVMVMDGVSKLAEEMKLIMPPVPSEKAYLKLFRHHDRHAR